MKFIYPFGATPLNEDEKEGLIPTHISTQKQLNEFEANNILLAEEWLYSQNHRGNFLTLEFLQKLHKNMFKNTWRWAGLFRGSNKNIGIDYPQITTQVKNLLEDVIYQIKFDSYEINEIAYRFHHRLVWIHPFPNGNGRFARLFTDFLLTQADEPKFTWGRVNLIEESITRKKYIDALKDADNHCYKALAAFVRS